jgi:hypothetical protein
LILYKINFLPFSPIKNEMISKATLIIIKMSDSFTAASYIAKFDEMVATLDEEITSRSKKSDNSVSVLKKVRKFLISQKAMFPKVMKQSRKRVTNGTAPKNNTFTKPVEITDELREFLQLKEDDAVSRVDITRAISVYIKRNEDEKDENKLRWAYLNPEPRNLQGKGSLAIEPDDALRKLLRFDEYLERVRAGEITRVVTNKQTNEKETVVVKDEVMRYSTIQSLIQRHINPSASK